MEDPPNTEDGIFMNIYIHHDVSGTQDSFPNWWAHGIGQDKFGQKYYTLPYQLVHSTSVYHEGMISI